MSADEIDIVRIQHFTCALFVRDPINDDLKLEEGMSLTCSRQSMASKSSLSNEFSSSVRMPPTFAYTVFAEKTSQKTLLAMTIEVRMNRWHVREETVKRGKRVHI